MASIDASSLNSAWFTACYPRLERRTEPAELPNSPIPLLTFNAQTYIDQLPAKTPGTLEGLIATLFYDSYFDTGF